MRAGRVTAVSPMILFVICLLLLSVVTVVIWRYWRRLAAVTPEEEAYDRRVARLNERQAHRVSDEELAQRISQDEAWRIMVARGQEAEEQFGRRSGDLSRRRRARRR
jgi:membrane protein implicated in regulation of membrane protease activity